MASSRRPHSFRYRLRESLVILIGRLPARLTTVDALTTAQGELAQSRAELSRIAKAAAEARARLSEVDLDLSRLREENARLRLAFTGLETELNASRAAGPQT
jgi:ATP phosphoribosyltransferase regulatory subunit HisZ